MACIRISSLFLVLLLSLASLGDSNASAQQALDVNTNSRDHGTLVTNKGLFQAEAEPAVMPNGRKWLRGRKMRMEKEMKGKMNTGANPSVGKYEHESGGKRDLNIECELRVSSKSPPSLKLVGLIPFSSDYHAPKTHPPKNN